MTNFSRDDQISQKDDRLVERYLDDMLSEEERTSFLNRLQSDRALQDQLDLAERLSTSLGRLFVVPEFDEPSVEQDRRRVIGVPRSIRLTLAAAAAVLAIGIAIKLNLPPTPIYYTLLERVYTTHESTGFTPEWICETDDEFAAAVHDRLGQPMLIDVLDTPIELLGWAYPQDSGGNPDTGYGDTIISDDSMILLIRVDGQGVFVIVDRVEDDREPLTIGDRLGLSVFRRVLDDLVLYEVTPLDAPRVLGRAYTPETGGE